MDFEVSPYLRDAIENDSLVVFVGAGLSASCGLPDWKSLVSGLLKDRGEYIEKSAGFLSALNSEVMGPLEILDKIEDDRKHVYQYFEGNLRVLCESEIHKKLAGVTGKFVTTNFDSLIESNSNIETVITHDSVFNLSKVDEGYDYVIKIHGDIGQVDKCIIFSSQYKDLYSGKGLAEFQLKKIFSSFNVLFIGFSMRDLYVKELFDYISSLYDGFGKTFCCFW